MIKMRGHTGGGDALFGWQAARMEMGRWMGYALIAGMMILMNPMEGIASHGSIPPADDHADNVSDATSVSLGGGGTTGGEIEAAGDRDYFSFDVPLSSEGHVFTIVLADPTTSVSSFDPSVIIETDTKIVLLDSDSTASVEDPLAANDDCLSPASLTSCILDWVAPTQGGLTTYYVRVEHFSTNGTGDYEITISDAGVFIPPDDFEGTNVDDAVPLSFGVSTLGELNPEGDRDYFSFTVPAIDEGDVYTIVLADPTTSFSTINPSVVLGETDTVVILLDSDSTVGIEDPLVDNDDCTFSTRLSCITWTSTTHTVPANTTYFIRLQHFSTNGIGDYTIEVNNVGAPTPVDDFEGTDVDSAVPLSLGVSTVGELNPAGDRDYFTFTVPVLTEPNVFEIVVSDPTTLQSSIDPSVFHVTDTVAILLDNDSTATVENPIAGNDDCGLLLTSCFTWEAPISGSPTSYWVRVQHFSVGGIGDYEIEVNQLGTPAPITDLHSDSFASASPLTLGVAVAGDLNPVEDQDYFVFSVSPGSVGDVFELVTTDPTPFTSPTDPSVDRVTDTEVILFDTDGLTPLAGNDDCGNSILSCLNWTATAAGDYYVLVQFFRIGTGDYEIEVNNIGTAAPIDDFEGTNVDDAIPLSLGVSTLGELNPAGDRDYFSFTVDAIDSGDVFEIVLSDPTSQQSTIDLSVFHVTDTVMILLDNDSTVAVEIPIAENDDCGLLLTSCITWESPVSGSPTSYFIRVQHFTTNGTGDYEIEVNNIGMAAPIDDFEGTDVDSAVPLTLGVSTLGELNPAGDRDYFSFPVPALPTETNVFEIVLSDPTTLQSTIDLSVFHVTDTVVILLDSNSTATNEIPIAENDDCGTILTSCITWEAPVNASPTTIYIRVQHFTTNGIGDYEIEVNNVGTSTPVTDLHGDTFDAATTLSLDVSTAGELNPAGDVDFFEFTVILADVGGVFKISTDDLTPITSSIDPSVDYVTDTVIVLYDTDGTTVLTGNDDCPPSFVIQFPTASGTLLSCISWTAPAAGTYYVSVRHYSNGTGDYEIIVESPP